MEKVQLKIKYEDLQIDMFRDGSVRNYQIRATHKPTGVTAMSSGESRSLIEERSSVIKKIEKQLMPLGYISEL